jgi:hypothetical protein
MIQRTGAWKDNAAMLNKRIFISITAAMLTQAACIYLFSYHFDSFFTNIIAQSATICFLGVLVGSLIAGRGFLLPAMVIWSIFWSFIAFVLSGNLHSHLVPSIECDAPTILSTLFALLTAYALGNYIHTRMRNTHTKNVITR